MSLAAPAGVIRIALALLLLLPACSKAVDTAPPPKPAARATTATTTTTAPAPPPVQPPAAGIRTDRPSYVLTPGPRGAETTIVATLRAPADQTLYITNCNGGIGATLQRKIGDTWVYALVTGMAACMSPPIVVPPGGEHTNSLYVSEGAVGIPDPQGGTMLKSGTYRVVWSGVFTSFDANNGGKGFGPELPLEQRVSGPITLEVPQ